MRTKRGASSPGQRGPSINIIIMKHIIPYYILLLALLLPVLPCAAQSSTDTPTADGQLDSRRTVWYDRDANENQPSVKHWRYLTNRRALVGRGCTVNKLISAVGVATWADSLGNVTNEDLTDYATFPAVLKAGVTVNPIVSVRDKNNYYGENTEAGFCVVASSGASVLTLDVVKAMSIVFYRDGKLGSTVPVEEGQNAGGVSLTLIKVPGSEDACICLTAKSKEIFDEVCLQPSGGVNLDLGTALKVKYAFVGKENSTYLTDNGVKAYGEAEGSPAPGAYIKKVSGENPVLLGIPFPMVSDETDKLVDDDLTNGAAVTPLIGAVFMGAVTIQTVPGGEHDAGQEVFKAGSEVGFKYKDGAVLDLSLGSAINIELYNRAGKKIQTETLSAGVLGLGVASGGDGTASILAAQDFSGARIAFYGGLKVNLGATVIYYGFVKQRPDVEHHCDIRPTPDTNVCDTQTSFQLHSNPDISVKWTLELQPEGASAQVTPSGYVTGMNTPGEYTFRATAADGCYEFVTLSVGTGFNSDKTEHCGTDFVNLDEAANGTYELMDSNIPDGTGALVSISGLQDGENLLDKDYGNCATYVGGLGVANNLAIAGVKRTDGLMFDGDAEGQASVNVGFVVESDNEVIDAKVLEFFQIRCYNDGEEVYRHVITESNAVAAGVGTSTKAQKVRFSIRVDPIDKDAKPVRFNQVVLWKSGVLDLGLSKLKLYYAFLEDTNSPCANALSCGAVVLSDTTGTTIHADACQMAGAVRVAGVDDNLSCLVDGNLQTAMTIVSSVDVGGGSVIAVNMGRTLDFRHQLGLVVDQKTYALGASVGGWLTVETYYRGEKTGDKFTDWNVLGANVAGYGEKNLLLMQPKEIYDEIRLTIAGVISALDIQKFYGIFIRGDIDNDGIPDCKDTESCNSTIRDIRVARVCRNGTVTISGTGTSATDYRIVMREQGVDDSFTTEHDGSFSRTYTMPVAGRFSMLFYDASGNLLNNAPYTVYPNLTTWRRDAQSSDWNEWNNWTDGSPYCCTDVVIPSKAQRYPVLEGTLSADNLDLFCCNDIHFAPGAAVTHTPLLNYAKAWTETELAPNRYHLLSATLQNTYSGDFFIPESMKGTHTGDYFTKLDETTSPQNRFNPIVYQRLWDKAATGRLADGTETAIALSETHWSRHFNHLAYPYTLGEGFSVWVDNDGLSADGTFRFRFPKEHTAYNYFSDFDRTEMDLTESGLVRDHAGRFIYEPLDAQPLSMTYSGYVEGQDVTQQRQVYAHVCTAEAPLSVHLTSEAATTFFLVGNPFQSYLKVKAFLDANPAVKAVKTYDGNTANTMVSTDGQLLDCGATGRVAPAEAFFVETADARSELTLVFTPDMLGGQASDVSDGADDGEGEGADSGVQSVSGLRLTLSNSDGLMTSAIVLDSDVPEVNSSTLFDAEAKPQLAVFALKDGLKAMDVCRMEGDRIPLGIYTAEADTALTLSCRAFGQLDMGRYRLLDVQTGMEYSLDHSVVLHTDGKSVDLNRYVLVCKSAAQTSLSQVKEGGAEPVEVSVGNRTISARMVASSSATFSRVQVMDIGGRMLLQQSFRNASSIQIPSTVGLRVVRFILSDGSTRAFRLWVD